MPVRLQEYGPGVHIHDLGSLVVEVEGRSIDLGSTKQAALLGRLVVSADRQVSADSLISAGWGPDAVMSSSRLDSQLWRLRNLLQPDRSHASSVLERSGSGYVLRVGPDEVDSLRFVRLAGEVERLLARGSAGVEVLLLIDEALSLWRGRPYEPVADLPEVAPAVTRLDELRSQLAERRIEALTAAGKPDRGLADLAPLIAETPYRERLWALRIELLARLGRTEEALTAYRQVHSLLRDELGLDPGPELRDLQSQILTGQLATSGSAKPVTAPDDSARSTLVEAHLPRRATRLLGRSGDLDRIVALVREQSIVTIVGPGGCGKTRLSVEVGASVADQFVDGVWFVDLTAAVDPALVPELAVSTLGLDASPIGDPLDRLANFVSDKCLLLILDNCEHVLDGAAQCVESILAAGGSSVVLATSREPLELDGEIIWTLSPLSVRESGPTEPVATSSAAELFVERARAASPALELGPGELAVVECICQAVDGLPLAIELAAARVRTFTVTEIAEQVAADPSRLSRIGRGRTDHRSTIYDTIEWSYRLLDADQQLLHRRLSVLAGEFPLAAARGTVPGRDEYDVAGGLATLVHGSMLVTHRSPGRPTSFAQLDTVRAHARRRLAEAGEEGEAVAARDNWVRDLLGRRPPPGRAAEAQWFDEVDEAYAVVRACLQDQLRPDGDPGLVKLGADLAFYWYYRSKVIEGSRWLTAAQSAGPRPRNPLEAGACRLRLAALCFLQARRDLAEPLMAAGLEDLDAEPEESAAEVAELLIAVASSAWACDAYDIMLALHERLSLLLAHKTDPHLDVPADMIGCVARLPLVPLEASKTAAAEGFDRAAEIENPFTQWMAASLRSGVALIEQNPADGLEWTKRLASIHLRFGSGGEAMILEALGNFTAMSGNFREAARLYAAAIGRARRAGSPWPNRPQTPAWYERTAAALTSDELAAASTVGASLSLEDLVASWS